MKEKISLERAKEIAEKLKNKYKFGKANCPTWFKNVCTPMQQDGTYDVAICIPAWNAISQEEANIFAEPFEGIYVTLRVITPPSHNYGRKNEPIEDKEKKRRSYHKK